MGCAQWQWFAIPAYEPQLAQDLALALQFLSLSRTDVLLRTDVGALFSFSSKLPRPQPDEEQNRLQTCKSLHILRLEIRKRFEGQCLPRFSCLLPKASPICLARKLLVR